MFKVFHRFLTFFWTEVGLSFFSGAGDGAGVITDVSKRLSVSDSTSLKQNMFTGENLKTTSQPFLPVVLGL